MKLDKSPFVIISVIGQELLAQARYVSAVKVLESALKIGTCSLKLRGSVFSALSSAYWALNSLDKVTVSGLRLTQFGSNLVKIKNHKYEATYNDDKDYLCRHLS